MFSESQRSEKVIGVGWVYVKAKLFTDVPSKNIPIRKAKTYWVFLNILLTQECFTNTMLLRAGNCARIVITDNEESYFLQLGLSFKILPTAKQKPVEFFWNILLTQECFYKYNALRSRELCSNC